MLLFGGTEVSWEFLCSFALLKSCHKLIIMPSTVLLEVGLPEAGAEEEPHSLASTPGVGRCCVGGDQEWRWDGHGVDRRDASNGASKGEWTEEDTSLGPMANIAQLGVIVASQVEAVQPEPLLAQMETAQSEPPLALMEMAQPEPPLA